MICRHCDCANDADALYCNACGALLSLACDRCGQKNRPGSRFCKACGTFLQAETGRAVQGPEAGSSPAASGGTPSPDGPRALLAGERKQVTVLFTDLCGYAALTDRLDPEAVNDIMASVFGEITRIIHRYEGFVEKYVGDAVMAVFGAGQTHEDDPLRAVRAAREIHQRVTGLTPRFQGALENRLAMHTGINTGLVVLGHLDAERGTHDMAGDAITLAARFSELAGEGEILVGPDTFLQCQGWFLCDALAPVHLKGKSEPVSVYRVLTSRHQPRKVHRAFGRRGAMIGRQAEMAQLAEAADGVRRGEGARMCIAGAAGTGKSRLLEEFKAALGDGPFAWYEGHAYPYARNIPYAPLIDLLNLACRIEEGDPPAVVREKIEERLGPLLASRADHLPYIGSLFGLRFPELGAVSPEYWRSRLQQAVGDLLIGLTREGPAVICIEDLHWADPSTVDLLATFGRQQALPVLLVCTYRRLFDFPTEDSEAGVPPHWTRIELNDLSREQTLEMVCAILDTPSIPQNLQFFIQEKIEGNPFYLEEMVNTLIDRKVLQHKNGQWRMEGAVSIEDVSATIHGVVAGRLDYLQGDVKHVLQEAAVIGRVFDYAILQRISTTDHAIDASLDILEQLDMIRRKRDAGEEKYYFKHALVQEIVYNGILIKDRREIHERIAAAMEAIFSSRLSGFYETLAFHYSVGQSFDKAVDYLMKSGRKSKQRYAVEEAHRYYQQAYGLLVDQSERFAQGGKLLVEVLIEWFFVFNVRGIFTEMLALLKGHAKEVAALDDAFLKGMYFCCMGWALQRREALEESYVYLTEALRIAEESDDRQVLAYACGCLVWTCTDLGRLDDAIDHGRRAEALMAHLESDQELIRIILTGLGIAHWFRGAAGQCRSIGEKLLQHGEKRADIRSISDGHLVCAMGHFAAGDFSRSIADCSQAIAASQELVHSFNSKFLLAYSYLSSDRVAEAEAVLDEVVAYSSAHGYDYIGSSARALSGMVALARGRLSRGFRIVQQQMADFESKGKRYHLLTFHYLVGQIYSRLAMDRNVPGLRFLWRNGWFLLRHRPLAARRAERMFDRALAQAESIGALGIAGQIYHDKARLYAALGKRECAREAAERCVAIFQEGEARGHLERARSLL